MNEILKILLTKCKPTCEDQSYFCGEFWYDIEQCNLLLFFHTTHGKFFASRNIVGEHELITVFS